MPQSAPANEHAYQALHDGDQHGLGGAHGPGRHGRQALRQQSVKDEAGVGHEAHYHVNHHACHLEIWYS